MTDIHRNKIQLEKKHLNKENGTKFAGTKKYINENHLPSHA